MHIVYTQALTKSGLWPISSASYSTELIKLKLTLIPSLFIYLS